MGGTQAAKVLSAHNRRNARLSLKVVRLLKVEVVALYCPEGPNALSRAKAKDVKRVSFGVVFLDECCEGRGHVAPGGREGSGKHLRTPGEARTSANPMCYTSARRME